MKTPIPHSTFRWFLVIQLPYKSGLKIPNLEKYTHIRRSIIPLKPGGRFRSKRTCMTFWGMWGLALTLLTRKPMHFRDFSFLQLFLKPQGPAVVPVPGLPMGIMWCITVTWAFRKPCYAVRLWLPVEASLGGFVFHFDSHSVWDDWSPAAWRTPGLKQEWLSCHLIK